jgi:hypothetical protein
MKLKSRLFGVQLKRKLSYIVYVLTYTIFWRLQGEFILLVYLMILCQIRNYHVPLNPYVRRNISSEFGSMYE